ncbi:MAG: hypothetical protein IJO46_15635 [Thermoguttaceae bacterium]|nr:hypothetical protein [Thermoguttaceae bacterium]
METEERIRELDPLFEERERRRRAESLLSLAEAELDDARAAFRRARRLIWTLAAFAATAFVAFALK